MENRDDLNSILEFLPVVLRSSAFFWPSQVVEALKALSKGPDHSNVNSGEVLFLAICDLRNSLNLSADALAYSTADGFSLFFDDLISRAEANKWFAEILPPLADSLLRLPSMLEAHYQAADSITRIGARAGLKTGLRLLKSQEPGIVLLSQELIGALLACSFFCLFPNSCREANNLNVINFDHLFASLYDNYNEKQENKIKCIIHYFERICSSMPVGNVSFERKVLADNHNLNYIPYPNAECWSKSMASLCLFEVCSLGLIEDTSKEALEVDFANKYLGGGALTKGCLQVPHLYEGGVSVSNNQEATKEDDNGDFRIFFLINIDSKKLQSVEQFFFPIWNSQHFFLIVVNTQKKNVEVWDSWMQQERDFYKNVCSLLDAYLESKDLYSQYTNSVLKVPQQPNTYDCGMFVFHYLQFPEEAYKLQTRKEEIRFMISPELIVGMLFLPGMEDNEAIEVVGAERFSKYKGYASSFQFCGDFLDKKDIDIMGRRKTRIIAIDALVNPGERQYRHKHLLREINKAFCGFSDPSKSEQYQMLLKGDDFQEMSFEDEIGIVTGNWGCGAFGGDPEVKAVLQWLAASQALRPFMVYYTFSTEALQTLEQVTKWIMDEKWNVGELWKMVVKYSFQRCKKETGVGFFNWLLPFLSADDPMVLDSNL